MADHAAKISNAATTFDQGCPVAVEDYQLVITATFSNLDAMVVIKTNCSDFQCQYESLV